MGPFWPLCLESRGEAIIDPERFVACTFKEAILTVDLQNFIYPPIYAAILLLFI